MILALVVLSGEVTILVDLAYLSWPRRAAWALWLVLSGVMASGIASVVLRIVARESDVRTSFPLPTLDRQMICSQTLGSRALWVPPALSSAIEGGLLVMQINAVRTDTRIPTGKTWTIAAVAIRQL